MTQTKRTKKVALGNTRARKYRGGQRDNMHATSRSNSRLLIDDFVFVVECTS